MDKSKPFANIYYFRLINRIGGTEQFLYELAKKYHKYDLTIMYDECDFDQLMRLKKLVRCIRRNRGKKYYAKRAFYNFNIEAIEQIEADEHIFVCHAIYQELGYKPPINHPKISKVIGVSKYAEAQIIKQEEIQHVEKPVEYCYNPLTLEEVKPVIRIVSACRLEDQTKGGQRTMRLIEALDRYCRKNNRNYIWTIFTNHMSVPLTSPNVVYMKPRTDVRPYIADADWLVQVSNNMESYCYSINEALGYNTRVVRTPLTVCKEFNIPKQAELILDWDCGNVDEIAEKMFKPKRKFSYKAPEDNWEELLVTEPSEYKYKEENVLVKPLKSYFDLEIGRHVSTDTPAFEVSNQRARELASKKLVRVV